MHNGLSYQKLPSGLRCYVIQKTGYVEKQAVIAVHYGSADYQYSMNGNKIETPQGIAHFLEHKLFEDEKLNLFETFTRQGANVNAFTNFTHTAYYFNTIDRFDENLALLFHMVGNPYFTDENVEKEKGIIAQEITMYEDNPHWKVYINLNRALFHQSPVRFDIAGTIERIQTINPDVLYNTYQTFYKPPYMALICVGDIAAESVFAMAEQYFGNSDANENITRHYGDEPSHAAQPYVAAEMPVSMPIFQIGFKAVYDHLTGEAMAKQTAALKILTDMIAGESAALYGDLYNEGLIDNRFAVEYIGSVFHGTSLFAGSGPSPEAVRDRLLQTIAQMKRDGLSKTRFEIIKRKHIGRYLQNLNSIDHIATAQVDLTAKALDVFSLLDGIRAVTIADVEERLHHHMRDDNHALSVVRPPSRQP